MRKRAQKGSTMRVMRRREEAGFIVQGEGSRRHERRKKSSGLKRQAPECKLGDGNLGSRS